MTVLAERVAVESPEKTGGSDRHLLAIVVTVAATAFLAAVRLRLHAPPTGDEPAYLVISQTMQKYHSIDILRDHLHGDYHSFYPGVLDPHVVIAPNGRRLPFHSIGGPLLWLVPFMVWGRAGACLLIALVSVLIVANVFRFLREQGIQPRYAFLTTLFLALGSPIYVYSSMTFVDAIGALCVLYAVRVIVAERPGPWRALVAGLGLGYLPWVHSRFLVFTLFLTALAAWRVRPRLPLVIPVAVLFALFELYTALVWGTLNPTVSSAANHDGPFQTPLYTGLLNLLFDRQVGLIPNYPIFVLVLPGVLLSARRAKPLLHLAVAVAILPYLVGVGTFHMWWAGFSPPARFLVVIVPLLSFYVAYVLQRLDSVVLVCAALVLAAFAYATSLGSDVRPGLRFSTLYQPNRALLQFAHTFGGQRLLRYIPTTAPSELGLFLAWVGGTVAVGLALWAAGRWLRTAPASPG